jgi:hypothetical protein
MATAPSFDSLPSSLLAKQAPPGFCVRTRVPLPGKTLQETDELVIAAGGWREGPGVRGEPSIQHVAAYDWYVLPVSAFD